MPEGYTIERDEGLSALLPSREVVRICGGFQFTEGPVWVPADGCLLFSDIPANRIYRWQPGAERTEVYREPSRNSNGLTLDRDGNLLACEHSGRQISRGPYGGDETTLVDQFQGKRVNSPNDVVVHSSGAIYFTDPTYGLRDAGHQPEVSFQGVYRLDPSGQLRCVEAGFTQPNGLALSPDESVLYVGDSQDRIIRRFAVAPDGTLHYGALFVNMRQDHRHGPPDGMKVDEAGRLWTTGPGGVWVIAPDGTQLGIIVLDEKPANLAFGGPEFTTLYLTAETGVYQIETAVRGIAPGSRS